MKYVLVFLCVFVCSQLASSQNLEVVKYDQVEEMIESNSGKVKVLNFWATWCGPCIKELPHFEAANNRDNVEVILVSLDFIQDETKVRKFVERKNLQSQVLLLNEKDYDSYMSKVDESWSGAIPATLFITPTGKKHFYEKAFTANELEETLNQFVD